MRRKYKRLIKKIAYGFFVFFLLSIVALILYVLYLANQLPDTPSLFGRRISESTQIFDKTGEKILFDVHGAEKRTIVPWEEISDTVKEATVAAEDDEFYSHFGLDWKGILRAVYKNIVSGERGQGGSTITQQLIKNSLFGSDKTFSRKIKEALFAIKVERTFTKDQILWMYLNQIPYGSSLYGIEAASQEFFGKHASDLTIAEAALIASIPKAPTYYSPYGNNGEELENRRKLVLNKMLEMKSITQEEYDEAVKTVPEIQKPSQGIEAPHFVMMVRQYLIDKYGEDMVQNGGLKVITTLDMDIQELAEKTVIKYGDINAKQYRANNMALVAADPKTGQILAMIGSRDYFDVENDGNFNVAIAERQPGSSFKPFAYATAFSKGFTESTILFDVRTEFNPSCSASATQTYSGGACYHPNNYTMTFSGPVTMRQALARSLNAPAVKTLYLAGIPETISTAKRMGITTLNEPDRYGLALVLGGGEVKLMDMVNAYGTFANDGIHSENNFILQISTNDGRILEEYEKKSTRVIDSNVARTINSILSDNNARAPVFGFNSSLHILGRNVAAKTGTTQNNRDGWIIGYSPNLVTGIWTGNNDNTSMTAAGAGGSAAGPAWKEFMSQALASYPNTAFTPYTQTITTKPVLNGIAFGPDGFHSILYYVDKRNPLGPAPSNPYTDPAYVNWESAVQAWVLATIPQPTPIIIDGVSPQTTITPTPTPAVIF